MANKIKTPTKDAEMRNLHLKVLISAFVSLSGLIFMYLAMIPELHITLNPYLITVLLFLVLSGVGFNIASHIEMINVKISRHEDNLERKLAKHFKSSHSA